MSGWQTTPRTLEHGTCRDAGNELGDDVHRAADRAEHAADDKRQCLERVISPKRRAERRTTCGLNAEPDTRYRVSVARDWVAYEEGPCRE